MAKLDLKVNTFRVVIAIFLGTGADGTQAQTLPRDDVVKRIAECLGAENFEYKVNIRREVEKTFREQGTEGFKSEKNFLDKFSPEQRVAAYNAYVRCIRKEVSLSDATITVQRWYEGGWDVLLTNPTNQLMSVTEAKLVAIDPKPNKKFDYAFSLFTAAHGQIIQAINIASNQATAMSLLLFGPRPLCNNWKEIRRLRFDQRANINSWSCRIDVDLVSASGERTIVRENFDCSRIPVPPPPAWCS